MTTSGEDIVAEAMDGARPGLLGRILPGAVLLAVGLLMLVICWGYPRGTLSQMGPGYIPTVIGVLISLFSVAIIIGDLLQADLRRAPGLQWRELVFISAAILAFAGLIDPLGLVPAMFVATALSMIADDKIRLPTLLIYSTLATLAGWLLFIVALELPISSFWR